MIEKIIFMVVLSLICAIVDTILGFNFPFWKGIVLRLFHMIFGMCLYILFLQ